MKLPMISPMETRARTALPDQSDTTGFWIRSAMRNVWFDKLIVQAEVNFITASRITDTQIDTQNRTDMNLSILSPRTRGIKS